MGIKQRIRLTRQAIKLADLIVQAKPARIQFQSEQQFFELLGLQPKAVPVHVERRYD